MVLATECTLAVEPLFGTAKGVRGNLPPPRHARTLFLPMLTALGARVCRVEAPPAKEPEAGAGRGGAASWVQHEQCACPGVPFATRSHRRYGVGWCGEAATKVGPCGAAAP